MQLSQNADPSYQMSNDRKRERAVEVRGGEGRGGFVGLRRRSAGFVWLLPRSEILFSWRPDRIVQTETCSAEQRRSAAPGFIPAAWNTGAAHSNGIYTIYTINVCEGTDCSPGVDLSTVLSVRGSVQRRRLLFPTRRHMTTTDDFVCRYTDQGEFRSPTPVQPCSQGCNHAHR